MSLKSRDVYKVTLKAIEDSTIFDRISKEIKQAAESGNFCTTVDLEGISPLHPESLQIYFERLGYHVVITSSTNKYCKQILINWK